jgi:predicted O-methyltransferase YrrM
MTQTHAHHDHGHHQQHRADSEQAEILDLDAEVLAEHIAAITEWLPLKSGPRQIVDLASGTGAGTFALLERFPEAHVTAVDASPGHLERLREKACARGVGEHVRTVLAAPSATCSRPTACSLSSSWPAFPASCPRTPPPTGPAWKTASTP